MYELPQGRRIGPALIAVLVVLAGAAGTVGYFVARQILDGQNGTTVAGPSTSETSGPNTSAPGTGPTGNTQSPPQTTSATPPEPVDGNNCPKVTIDAVRAAGRPASLKRVLYVEVTKPGTEGAEAWICQDTDGTLYYQGHNKNGPIAAATSDSTILLGKGIRGDVVAAGVGFIATNPSGTDKTEYIVTREVLTIVNPGNQRDEYQVVRYLPV